MSQTQTNAPQSNGTGDRVRRPEPLPDQLQKQEMAFTSFEGFTGGWGTKDPLKRAKDPTPETQVSRKDDTSTFYDSLLGTSMMNPATEKHIALLSDPRATEPVNVEQTSQITNHLQRSYGNGYVQRVIDRDNISRAIESSVIQRGVIH